MLRAPGSPAPGAKGFHGSPANDRGPSNHGKGSSVSGSHVGEPAPQVAGAGQDEPAGPGVAPPSALSEGADQAPEAGASALAPAVLEAADDEAV